MKFDPYKHHRRSTRLRGYDYTQTGMYFVTICVQHHENLFGAVVNGEMQLNELGQIVADEWLRSLEIRPEIEFDAWIIMPNHMHGIVIITSPDSTHVGAHSRAPQPQNRAPQPQNRAPLQPRLLQRQPRSLGSFIAGFKSAATKRINLWRGTPGADVWQRNYYDHIIRNERERSIIAAYIVNNPANWSADLDYPGNVAQTPQPRTSDDYWRDAGLMT